MLIFVLINENVIDIISNYYNIFGIWSKLFENLIKLSVNITHHIDEKMRMIGNIYFSFHSPSLWFEL